MAGGGVVEATLARAIGGKGREEVVEVIPVGAVGDGSGLVETLMG